MHRKTCQNDCPKCVKCWCSIFAHWTSPNDEFCDYARKHRLTKRRLRGRDALVASPHTCGHGGPRRVSNSK